MHLCGFHVSTACRRSSETHADALWDPFQQSDIRQSFRLCFRCGDNVMAEVTIASRSTEVCIISAQCASRAAQCWTSSALGGGSHDLPCCFGFPASDSLWHVAARSSKHQSSQDGLKIELQPEKPPICSLLQQRLQQVITSLRLPNPKDQGCGNVQSRTVSEEGLTRLTSMQELV